MPRSSSSKETKEGKKKKISAVPFKFKRKIKSKVNFQRNLVNIKRYLFKKTGSGFKQMPALPYSQSLTIRYTG